MTDSLGDRIKGYESNTKYSLMRRAYTIIRLDGACFSKYTKNLNAPFDRGLVEDMIETTKFLCKEIQGVKLGYTQSDEITLVITDFDDYKTQPWHGNEIQKMISLAASKATAKFNQLRLIRELKDNEYLSNDYITSIKLANFDARIFQLPTLTEVNNMLIWRQRDFIRNSISLCAQTKGMYSHTEMKGKTSNEKQEFIFAKGSILKEKLVNCGYDNNVQPFAKMNAFSYSKENFNWNDIPPNLKRGTTVTLNRVTKFNGNGIPYERNIWEGSAFTYNSESKSLLPILDNSIM